MSIRSFWHNTVDYFNKLNTLTKIRRETVVTARVYIQVCMGCRLIKQDKMPLSHQPVCAHAIRSLLARTTGKEYFWTGVGLPYLHNTTLFSMISPNSTSENCTNSTHILLESKTLKSARTKSFYNHYCTITWSGYQIHQRLCYEYTMCPVLLHFINLIQYKPLHLPH